jgi:hypothetical protein
MSGESWRSGAAAWRPRRWRGVGCKAGWRTSGKLKAAASLASAVYRRRGWLMRCGVASAAVAAGGHSRWRPLRLCSVSAVWQKAQKAIRRWRNAGGEAIKLAKLRGASTNSCWASKQSSWLAIAARRLHWRNAHLGVAAAAAS